MILKKTLTNINHYSAIFDIHSSYIQGWCFCAYTNEKIPNLYGKAICIMDNIL